MPSSELTKWLCNLLYVIMIMMLHVMVVAIIITPFAPYLKLYHDYHHDAWWCMLHAFFHLIQLSKDCMSCTSKTNFYFTLLITFWCLYHPEPRRMSTVSADSNHNVVAIAKGSFTTKGGILKSPETGVSIVIPEGALDCDDDQEIYFKVCQDTSMLPPLDQDKGL